MSDRRRLRHRAEFNQLRSRIPAMTKGVQRLERELARATKTLSEAGYSIPDAIAQQLTADEYDSEGRIREVLLYNLDPKLSDIVEKDFERAGLGKDLRNLPALREALDLAQRVASDQVEEAERWGVRLDEAELRQAVPDADPAKIAGYVATKAPEEAVDDLLEGRMSEADFNERSLAAAELEQQREGQQDYSDLSDEALRAAINEAE